jgi:hypothetical protein
MELAFAEKPLRDLCEREAKAVQLLGAAVAAKLHARLSDLRAAETFADIRAGRPRFSRGDIHLQLSAGYVLVLAGSGAGPAAEDWKKFTRVKILSILKP